jgi:hypothetical protein
MISSSGMAIVPVIRVDVRGKLQWACRRTESGNWIGVCDPLGLTVQSETWGELMEDIALTLDAILRDLLASNELDRFLRDHGWHVTERRDLLTARPEEVRFDVPFLPAFVAADGSARVVP